MKHLSLIGVGYTSLCVATCVWFGAAVKGGWRGPDLGVSGGSGGSYFSGGSSYGRSSGGFWGGGK